MIYLYAELMCPNPNSRLNSRCLVNRAFIPVARSMFQLGNVVSEMEFACCLGDVDFAWHFMLRGLSLVIWLIAYSFTSCSYVICLLLFLLAQSPVRWLFACCLCVAVVFSPATTLDCTCRFVLLVP